MRRLAILILAILSGGLTFLVAIQPEPVAPQDPATVQTEATVEVLTFAQALERGSYVNRQVLTWQRQLATAVPDMAITRSTPDQGIPDAVLGLLLRADVQMGDPVRLTSLVEGSASFMALAVKPGMRAVAIRVTPEKIAGGYILPDDRVDVVHTVVRDGRSGQAGSQSAIILRNVRVLAVGDTPTTQTVFQTAAQQEANATSRSSTSLKGETVTLEVTEEQAIVLSSAASIGQLSLALRPIEDQGAPSIGDLSTIMQPAPEPAATPVTADPTDAEEPAKETLIAEPRIPNLGPSVMDIAAPPVLQIPPLGPLLTEVATPTRQVTVISGDQVSIIEVPASR